MKKRFTTIPEALEKKFHGLERRLWWVDTVLALSGALISLIVSYAVLFVSDRFWDTPAWLRVSVTVAGWGLALFFAWSWLRHWWWQRRDAKDLSGIVQKHYRRLGDRLLGIVELADETKRPANVSPALCRAAIRQVSDEAVQFDFRQAVATRRPRLFAMGALVLILIMLAPWLLVPEASWNTLHRWLWPGGATPRYTFVNVEDLPDRLIVAHGEAFEIAFGVRYHPFWRPDEITARLSGQPEIQTSVAGRRVTLPIPGQNKPGDLSIRVGDITRRVAIRPVLRPAMRSLRARVRFPEYLRHPPGAFDVERGTLRVLEGSAVSFEGLMTRALDVASLDYHRAQADESDDIASELDGDAFRTAWLDPGGGGQGTFVWRDQYGLTSAAPWRVTVETHPDEIPTADCPGQAAVVAMLEDEILEIEAVSRDDYGLRELAMAWDCQKPAETNILEAGVTVLAEGSPQTRELRGTFKLAPTLMKLPADTLVTLRARAWDYHPDRPPSESMPVRVYILSQEEHARLIQRELETIMAELEEVARRQEALLETGQALRESQPDGEEAARQLRAQATEQAELARRLSELASRTTSTLKEALRNQSIPTDLLQEWTEHAQAMSGIAAQPMAGAAQSLQAAEKNEASRTEDLSEALAMEQQALERIMELQRKLGPAMDRMLANTLVQRFRRVAQVQAEIRHELETILPRTIGLTAEDLEQPDRQFLASLAREEGRARDESLQLQDEVSRFYERTVERVYGTVAHEMKTSETVQSLGGLAQLIQGNVGAVAMREASEWKDRFDTWAEKLEQARKESQAGGSGGGGGSMSEEAMRRLLALMRLRMREIALREHTRFLEEGKDENQGYREDGIMLSLHQMFLREDVDELDRAKPGKFLPHAAAAMNDAENFLMEPRTDDPTVSAETDAVNLLESEINEMMKNAQGSGMIAAMSMMMQMMGMNAGAAPGGSLAGGDTDAPQPGLEGDMKGTAQENDDTERRSGGRTRPVPVEYREAMQRYQKALDKLQSTFEEAAP